MAEVLVAPPLQVAEVEAEVPPRHKVEVELKVKVPEAPGPVIPVSKLITPAVTVSEPEVAKVGVAPLLIIVAAALMVRL